MALWHVLLYTLGTALALRSLVSLMAHHKQTHERKLRNQVREKTAGSEDAESATSSREAA